MAMKAQLKFSEGTAGHFGFGLDVRKPQIPGARSARKPTGLPPVEFV